MFECKFIRRKTTLYDDSEPITTEVTDGELYALGMCFEPPHLDKGGEILSFDKKQYMLPANGEVFQKTDLENSIDLCYGMVASGEFDTVIEVNEPTSLGKILDDALGMANDPFACIFIEGECKDLFGKYLTVKNTGEKPFPNLSLNFSVYNAHRDIRVSGLGIISMGTDEIISPFLMRNEEVNDGIDYHIHMLCDEGNINEQVVHLYDMTLSKGTIKIANISETTLTEL